MNNAYTFSTVASTFDTQTFVLRILLVAAIAIVIFIIIREIVTWYWKINKIVSLLEKIEKNTASKNQPVVNQTTSTPIQVEKVQSK